MTSGIGWVEDMWALLEESDEQIKSLASLHDEAMKHASARRRFKTRIKNILENQRSALDYLAVGLTNEFGTPKGLIYFPLAQSETEFPSLMEKNMPGVTAAFPNIADAIKQHQPFEPDHWLRELNQLTREHKHNRPTQQLVREVFQCRVTHKATGAIVMWKGVQFSPNELKIVATGGGFQTMGPDTGVPHFELFIPPTGGFRVFGVPIDLSTQEPFPNEGLAVESGPLHEFCFVRPHKPVLVTLRYFQGHVNGVIYDVLQASPL